MLQDFTEYLTYQPALSCMLLSATTTSAFTTCMTWCILQCIVLNVNDIVLKKDIVITLCNSVCVYVLNNSKLIVELTCC